MIKANSRYTKNLICSVCLFAMLAMIKKPEEVISATKNALALCGGTLIPSVFPFMAAASVFINYSDNNYKVLTPFFKIVFGTSSRALCALIPGVLCGYPVGANCVCELYKKDEISKSEAESLLAYSNNSGPLFVIGAVGAGLLGSAKLGLMLYLIHIMASMLCGIILKPFTEAKKSNITITIKTKRKNFTDCIADSTLNILKVCGFVIVFAVINELLKPLLRIMPDFFRCLVSAFLELTNAMNIIVNSPMDEKNILVLLSAALGWSGMSVHMQVKNIISETDLSMKKYYIMRFLSCVISLAASFFVFKKPTSAQAFEKLSYGILFIIPMLLFKKMHTKKASQTESPFN